MRLNNLANAHWLTYPATGDLGALDHALNGRPREHSIIDAINRAENPAVANTVY